MAHAWRSTLGVWMLLAGIFCAPVWGQTVEKMTTRRATALLEAPDRNAAQVAPLAANAEVTVVARQAGWVRVDAAGQRGWVADADLRQAVVIAAPSTPVRSGFLSWFTAVLKPDRLRAAAGQSAVNRPATATVGIRGLGQDGGTVAKFDAPELQQLKLYSVSRADAEDFASEAGLAAANVPYAN